MVYILFFSCLLYLAYACLTISPASDLLPIYLGTVTTGRIAGIISGYRSD